ncbi:Uncharacterized protein K02A2.6, partial [Paramuricea clavata]
MMVNGVIHVTSTPLWPQGNGDVERQNHTLLKSMRIAYAAGKDWRKELNKFLMAYRTTPHTTTGASPAKLLFGREFRTKGSIEQTRTGLFADDTKFELEKGKIYADRKRQAANRQIKTGDLVRVKNAKPKNKLSSMFEDALYKVKNKDGNEVTVESEDGVQYRKNSVHVKRYETEECDGEEIARYDITDCYKMDIYHHEYNTREPKTLQNKTQRKLSEDVCEPVSPRVSSIFLRSVAVSARELYGLCDVI